MVPVPAVAYMLTHVIAVCQCPTKMVVVLPMAGHGECPACHMKWRIKRCSFMWQTTPDGEAPTTNVELEQVGMILPSTASPFGSN